jgi:stage II sporulation protein E
VKKRILSAAKSFDALSKIYEESPQYEYSKTEIINMFNDTAEKVCSNCSSRFICWQNDYKKTYSEMFEMLKIADEKGIITPKNMPESFKNKCSNTDAFALAFSGMTEKMSIHKMWRARLFESRKNASNQLVCIGKVLKEICSDINICVDTQFEKVIKTEFDKAGVEVKSICAVAKENDKFEISVCVNEKNEKTKEEIKDVISNLVNCEVRVLDSKEKNEENIYKVIPREKYYVEVGICQKTKDKETVCGDSVLSSYANGSQILAISDGMGSGMSAHKESKSAIKLLKGFFDAGFNTETSLKLINSFLLQNNTENFTTMDILSIDLDEGTLRFTKVGGAQSNIKKGINEEKIIKN